MKLSAPEYRDLVRGLLAEGRPVTLRATGLSMGSAIPDGASIKISPTAPSARGQVVLYEDPAGNLICHRIVRLWRLHSEQWMQTWGDTADRPDAPVPVTRVLGVVSGVPGLGLVRTWWRGLKARRRTVPPS